jgi:Protein phosphatase 2C
MVAKNCANLFSANIDQERGGTDTTFFRDTNSNKTDPHSENNSHIDLNDPKQHSEIISGQSTSTGSMTGDDCSLMYDEVEILSQDDTEFIKIAAAKHPLVAVSSFTQSAEVLRDAMVCESIRRAYETMDASVRSQSNSGSTVTSIYIDLNVPTDAVQCDVTAGATSRPVKVYCANVGDSRCVMLKSYDTAAALTLPSFYKRKQKDSHSVHRVPLESVSEKGAQVATDEKDKISVRNTYSLLQKSTKYQKAAPLTALRLNEQRMEVANRFTAVHLMSEDHKLSLCRERLRIMKDADPVWRPLPSDASAIFLPLFVRTAPPLSPLSPFQTQCAMTQASASSHGIKYDLPTTRSIATAPMHTSLIGRCPSAEDQISTRSRGAPGFEIGLSNTSHGALSRERRRIRNGLGASNGKSEVRI